MRKGFTLVECMLAGSILSIAAVGLMQGLGVLTRVAAENAEMLEADAVAWDALAVAFNGKYDDIALGTTRRSLSAAEAPRLTSEETSRRLASGESAEAVLSLRVRNMPVGGTQAMKSILCAVEWGGTGNRKALTNFVYRSDIRRGEAE